MSEIIQIIFFFSKFSENCKKPIEFIENYKLPVEYICVDSTSIKKKLKPLNFIKNVPSLIVIYDNGKSNLYEGSKVLLWLSNYVKMLSSANSPIPYEEHQQLNSPPPTGNNYIGGDYSSQYKNSQYSTPNNNDEQYELLEEPQIPKTKKDEKSSELRNIAKQMEMERKRTIRDSPESE